jgi:tight adherence protein B
MTAVPTAALLLAVAVLMMPPPVRHRLRTAAADRTGRPARVAAVPILLAVTVGVVMVAPPALAMACAIVAVVTDMRRRRWARDRQRRAQARAMAAALDILMGELRVGAHPLRALAVAAAESDGEVGLSLRSVAARARLGADVPAGLRSISANSSVPVYWDRLAVFWQLAAEHGLAMSTLMAAAHRDILDRQRFSERMRAALAGARATAVILAVLPAVGVLLGHIVGAHPLRFLLGSDTGGVFLVVGVGLACAGMVWADRIVDRVAA